MLRARTILGVLVALTACAAPGSSRSDTASALPDAVETGPPGAPPSIRGTVTAVHQGDSVHAGNNGQPNTPVSCPPDCGPPGPGMRGLLIEESPGAATGGDKSRVTVPAGVRIWRRSGERWVEVGFSELRTGQIVSAWFTGPVAESYPTQATARTLAIER